MRRQQQPLQGSFSGGSARQSTVNGVPSSQLSPSAHLASASASLFANQQQPQWQQQQQQADCVMQQPTAAAIVSSASPFHSNHAALQLNSVATINAKPVTSLSSLSSSTKIRSPSQKEKHSSFATLPHLINGSDSDLNYIRSKSSSLVGAAAASITASSTSSSYCNAVQRKPVMDLSATANCKKKRTKLVELLADAGWQKANQIEKNMSKLKKLLASCDANFVDEKSGESPLSSAVSSPHLQSPTNSLTLSSAMLQPKSMPNHLSTSSTIQSGCSKTPAVEQVLTILVRFGAALDFKNKDGRTALHTAAIKSNFWALKTLLELGASANYRDNDGLTPLYYSILHKANLKVTHLLLNEPAQSASLKVVDQHGWQEVHHACKLGLEAHLERLLYYGCDMNAKICGSGNTPLHLAAINDKLDCAKVLLMRGADKSLTNNSHQTAYQVAVISGNMDLAEFIAEHNESKVVPFKDQPAASAAAPRTTTAAVAALLTAGTCVGVGVGRHQQAPSHLVSGSMSMSALAMRPGIGNQPPPPPLRVSEPLSVDLSRSSLASVSNLIQGSNALEAPNNLQPHLRVQVSSISPCLSQRSCATSNTTSSSGVCCGEDSGHNSSEEPHNAAVANAVELAANSAAFSNTLTKSSSQQSRATAMPMPVNSETPTGYSPSPQSNVAISNYNEEDEGDEDEESKACVSVIEDERSSGSSGAGELMSLISDERPLFFGSIVEAISEYQSGDPSHLQLRRADTVQVLDYPQELLDSQADRCVPRIANKPMLYGKRLSDGCVGLFPSFCVKRSKLKASAKKCSAEKLRKNARDQDSSSIDKGKLEMASQHFVQMQPQQQQHQQIPLGQVSTLSNSSTMTLGRQSFGNNNSNGRLYEPNHSLPESQSSFVLGAGSSNKAQQQQQSPGQSTLMTSRSPHHEERQVLLMKGNEGFGFVLRGAKVSPLQASLDLPLIDERVMAATNLISLQYFDEIEKGSVAHKAGLLRGDFLIAVNDIDVRRSSHEHVVNIIRASGNKCKLTVASLMSSTGSAGSSLTLARAGLYNQRGKVKPVPPKRDPSNTLTRTTNTKVIAAQLASRNHSINSAGSVAGSLQSSMSNLSTNSASGGDLFDANKPLPHSPQIQNSTAVGNQGASICHKQITSSSQNCCSSNNSSSSTATLTTMATVVPHADDFDSTVATDNGDQLNSKLEDLSLHSDTQSISSKFHLSLHDNISQQQQQAPPPPPPPPPPISDSMNVINTSPKNSASTRRASMPAITPLVIDKNQLLKKRESLAIVGNQPQTAINKSSLPSSSGFGVVAAACAAAANDRIRRQESTYQKLASKVTNAPFKDSQASVVNAYQQQAQNDSFKQTIQQEQKPSLPLLSLPSLVENQTETRPAIDPKSATLCQRVPAQIIQQPKPQQKSKNNQQSQVNNAADYAERETQLPVAEEGPAMIFHQAHVSNHSNNQPKFQDQQNMQQQQQLYGRSQAQQHCQHHQHLNNSYQPQVVDYSAQEAIADQSEYSILVDPAYINDSQMNMNQRGQQLTQSQVQLLLQQQRKLKQQQLIEHQKQLLVQQHQQQLFLQQQQQYVHQCDAATLGGHCQSINSNHHAYHVHNQHHHQHDHQLNGLARPQQQIIQRQLKQEQLIQQQHLQQQVTQTSHYNNHPHNHHHHHHNHTSQNNPANFY